MKVSDRNEGASVTNLIRQSACNKGNDGGRNTAELNHEGDGIKVRCNLLVNEEVEVHVFNRPCYLSNRAEEQKQEPVLFREALH